MSRELNVANNEVKGNCRKSKKSEKVPPHDLYTKESLKSLTSFFDSFLTLLWIANRRRQVQLRME